MKSSSPLAIDQSDDSQSNSNKPTPTELSPRPTLVRSSPPGRLSEISQEQQKRAKEETASPGDGAEISKSSKVFADGEVKEGRTPELGSDAERLATVRDAVNAKLVVQQRMRRSHPSPNSDLKSTRARPVQEEGTSISPSKHAAIANLDPGTGTDSPVSSSESTESGKTVRISQVTSPAGGVPLRTPSYPFPYVPGNARSWASSFHQPFMALSPTPARPVDEEDSSRKPSLQSDDSTPAATANDFLPPGVYSQGPEDPRFPTPNLYEMVLQLNAEPGLEQWWTTVANLMHDHFRADRATLVVPLDPTDIENVPWGQKATFSMHGPEEFVPRRTVAEQMSNATAPLKSALQSDSMPREPAADDIKPQKLHAERLRPRLEGRHSYAGHGRDTMDSGPTRPSGPQRTATHAGAITDDESPARFPAHRFPSYSTQRQASLNDPEFSSIGGDVNSGPSAEVFPTVRLLNHEARPLIEAGGVNRVLDRGRLVTVTRDYDSSRPDEATRGFEFKTAEDTPTRAPSSDFLKIFGNYRSVFASDNSPSRRKDYEDYEQYPSSAWSQSPAPSPAVQADEDHNPFFASEQQQRVEDSFDPPSPKDYSGLAQVQAIGVDHASTVIHIPLMHPTISQPMQFLKVRTQSNELPQAPERSNTSGTERKAPIAILSIMNSVVPYPGNLTNSLKLLGPHLATSLAISQQFSSVYSQPVTIRYRRTASGGNMSKTPMTIEPTSLDDIMNAEIEGPPGSRSGSVTSPSDYSGPSKHSPSSSVVGTPGWDPATHGFAASKLMAETAGTIAPEMIDGYFDAKKRSMQRTVSNGSAQGQALPARSMRMAFGTESKQSMSKSPSAAKEDSKATQADRKSRIGASGKEDKSPIPHSSVKEHSPPRTAESISPQRPIIRHSISSITESTDSKRHSQLHSYGADYESSFGGLPSIASAEPRPQAIGHGRKSSYPEEMPPPSERLLRTIIDSVPVQIFTAEPETGKMTWVNSKFMIYRGQEARQVLNEPWHAIHPDDRNEFMPNWHRSLRTAQQLQQKVRLERFDGSYRWFYVRAAPLRDKKQRIVHWIGTMMDFHEQHLAEVNLARQHETAASEAKYRALANSSPQIVFAVNKTKGVTFCNTQWVHFSGQSEAQARGVGFMDHVHPDDLAKCKLPTFDEGSDLPKNVPISVPPDLKRKPSASANSSSGSSETEKGISSTESSPLTSNMPQRKLSELASTGILRVSRDADGRPSYATEVRLKSKEGAFRWHLVRLLLADEPLLRSDKDEETWYGTCTDINDHKALERDLKETMDEKSRFLSNMSHEIRTPLNGISGMVNFLIDSSLSTEQMEHVNIIRASTEGLRGLINDILDLSKAEAGMIQLNMDWLYVRALIEEVNDLTSAMAIDKGLELNYLVEEDVPAQFKGDRFRIRQILLNIVGNAIKFTQKGEVFVHCSTYISPIDVLGEDELFIKFEVIDTGRGFTDKEAEHLFKRFSQIDGSSTRQHGGTGLGLVISKQLAQLHGGDVSAESTTGNGATFMFYIKTTLPSMQDQPPTPMPTPSGSTLPILPMAPGIVSSPATLPKHVTGAPYPTPFPMDGQPKPSPKFAFEHSQSPSPYATSPEIGRDSPSVSSTSSDHSILSAARTSSIPSQRSSASSFMPALSQSSSLMSLVLPTDANDKGEPPLKDSKLATTSEQPLATDSTGSATSKDALLGPSKGAASIAPPMYSILVVCPLKYSREATTQHIEQTLPKNVPHQITGRSNLAECEEMIGGEDPVIFTHIIVVLQNVGEITALTKQVLSSPRHQSTSIVVITDFAQRRKIMENAPEYDYAKLAITRRLRFVFKPLKPSRFAIIFDPGKEREMSTDRNQDSAQQVAWTQKQVFEELKRRLGNTDRRVLLVEDNRTNQLVVLKYLAKVSIAAETAIDGVECTNKVFSQPHGHYSIILCDLHMPNKDGYQTCKEIREWEVQNKFPHLPIIALSANVLGDVQRKCVQVGFNSYLTKPVDFKELSTALMTFMDPIDPSKPHEFMKMKRGEKVAVER